MADAPDWYSGSPGVVPGVKLSVRGTLGVVVVVHRLYELVEHEPHQCRVAVDGPAALSPAPLTRSNGHASTNARNSTAKAPADELKRQNT